MKDNINLPKLKIVKPIGGFHGVSAIFPKLKDIFNYEEKKIIVSHGYPRFVSHPVIKIIESKFKEKFNALGAISCHSYESAVFLVIDYFFKRGNKIFFDEGLPTQIFEFLNQKFPNVVKKSDILQADILIVNRDGSEFSDLMNGKTVIALLGEESSDSIVSDINFDIIIHHDECHDIGIILIYNIRLATLLILRRHCGFNVSSRKIHKRKNVLPDKIAKHEMQLIKRISELEHLNTEHCYLYPSGMAAIFTALISLFSAKRPKFIALGSLYVDTLKILEKWPSKLNLDKTVFIRDDFENKLNHIIDEKTAGIILEIPSNPLIQLIDIENIVKVAHSKGAKVIVDNTIATPYNFNPFDYKVDIIVHSTTKFLSGKNNHIGGALLTNDNEIGNKLKNFNKITNLNMDFNDVKTLSRNIRKFEERMNKINFNSEIIANFLNNHKAVKKVYYPILENDPNYPLSKKYLKGGSGLLSFLLKESTKENAEKFYDNIGPPILKGPSLGSEKSLLSPYVIMAHYDESKEELQRLGLEFYLMRLSVGIEPVDFIIQSIESALSKII